MLLYKINNKLNYISDYIINDIINLKIKIEKNKNTK